jgi:S-adenosylmethionine synthetase
MDSNSRSRMWHDTLTNGRGEELEEFLISKQLNEKIKMKTFQSSKWSSNINLTISNSKLLKKVQEWEINEEGSYSDHKIIQFCIRQYNIQLIGNNLQGIKYITRGENIGNF